MDPIEMTAALYYDAWRNRRGDTSEVPLADDFRFLGPVASFDTAEGYLKELAHPDRARVRPHGAHAAR